MTGFSNMFTLINVMLMLGVPAVIGQVKPCDFPHINHGRLYYEDRYKSYFPASIGQRYSYYCDNNFMTASNSYWDYLYCTKDGWIPQVPCLRKCTLYFVENGKDSPRERTYWQNQSVNVDCHRGYSLPNGQTNITCTENGWSPPPKCLRVNEGCDVPHIPNGSYSPERIEHRTGDEITYECKEGFYPSTRGTRAICTRAGWVPRPRCSLKPCDFPHINHGRLYYETRFKPYFPVSIGQRYSYYCDNNFVTASDSYWDYLYCTKDGWIPQVPCLRKCTFKNVENGKDPSRERTYFQHQSVNVECYPGYSLPNGQTNITCTEDGWSPHPKCIRANVSCVNPPTVENAIIISPKMARYLSGHKVRYECNSPFEIFGEAEVMCHNGAWTEAPQCKDFTGKCGPPPPIENGDITSFPWQAYPQGSSVEYQCQSMYKLEGEKKITCRNGNWGKPPRCLRACVITEEIMEKYNITLKSGEKQKVYAETGDVVEFKCMQGYLPTTSQSFQVTCSDGQLEYPRCDKNSKMLV